MEANRGLELGDVRRRVGVGLDDLWLSYFGLGGVARPTVMEAYLRGEHSLDHMQHDLLAQAINEHAIDRGMDHPAPYTRLTS